MNELERQALDLFAAAALGELLRDDLAKPIEKQMGYEWACKYAFVIANQMMKERYNAYYPAETA